MTSLRITLQCAKLRLMLWRYLATKAARRLVLRAMRWMLDRMEPAG